MTRFSILRPIAFSRIATALPLMLLTMACALPPPGAPPVPSEPATLPLEDTPWSPHELQPCVASETNLPSFTAVFDSTAVAERLRALPESGVVLLSVAADSGKIARMRVIESSIAESTREAIPDALRDGLRPGARGPGFVGRIRVEVRPDAAPSFRVGLSQVCEPVLFNRMAFGSFLQQAASQTKARGTVSVWVMVDDQGRVTQTRVARSSGNHELDIVTLAVARRMQFLPARMDRLPVPVWVEVPVTVR